MGGLLDACSRDTAEQPHVIRQMGAHYPVRGFVPSGMGGVSTPPSRTKQNAPFIGVFLAPLLMGGLIELAQATCTGGNRSGDWLDFAANSIGVVAGNLIGMLLAKCFAKGRKG